MDNLSKEGKQRISKLAVAALIFGILGIILKPAPLVAIILAETFRYNNKKREIPLRGKGMAWWGFGLGVLFLTMSLAMIFIKK
jgi:hypothetical protein